MKKMINQVHVEGRLYQHDLKLKKVKNEKSKNFGVEFFQGSLSIATDEACTNIVDVHFTYVPPITSQGKESSTFTALKRIFENENSTLVKAGKDECFKVSVSASFGVNDWWSTRENKFVSTPRVEGSFVNIIQNLKAKEDDRRNFTLDFLMTKARRVEAQSDNEQDYVKLKGAAFDFRGALLPFEPISYVGADYFEGLDPETPHFLKVFGVLDFCNIEETVEEEGVFGTIVTTRQKRKKDWVINNISPIEYDFNDESESLTPAELQQASQNRELLKAEIKKSSEEYAAQSNTGSGFAAASAAPKPAATPLANLTANTDFDF